MLIGVRQCPVCGGPVDREQEQCKYCNSQLIHLSRFEQRKSEADPGAQKPPPFRSLGWLYKLVLTLSGLAAFVIYFLAFDSFSETKLVTISPLWFCGLNFGLSGLYTEKAVRAILDRKAKTFSEGLALATRDSSPFVMLLVTVVFFPPFLFFGVRRRLTSPLLISLTTTAIWGAILYLFLVGIFPSL